MFPSFDKTQDFIVISEDMLFGQRLLEVRKKRKVSQDELAKRIGVHAPIIGRYERNEVKPSIEVAAKIAEAIGVSLDYLTGISDQELDQAIVKQINDLQQLHEDDLKHILKTMSALIRDAKTRVAYRA
jgi:transcriptional regulator with XRE-family HTH domain